MGNLTTKMNGYRTPEMIAASINTHGHYVGCSMLDDRFLNKYYIYDAGSYKVGVEVTFLNGKAVATRNVSADHLTALVDQNVKQDIKFGDF